MSDPYAETDEWLTSSLPARPVFDRADNTARLALEVASLKRENARLRAVLAAPPAAPEDAGGDESRSGVTPGESVGGPRAYASAATDTDAAPVSSGEAGTGEALTFSAPLSAALGEASKAAARADQESVGKAMVGPPPTPNAYEVARYALGELRTDAGFVLGDVVARLVLDSGAVVPAPVVAPSAEEPAEDGA